MTDSVGQSGNFREENYTEHVITSHGNAHKVNGCPSLQWAAAAFGIMAHPPEWVGQTSVCLPACHMGGGERGGWDWERETMWQRVRGTETDWLVICDYLFPAWSDSSRCSWFIQTIYDVFSQNWETMDLLTMMTRVNKKVAHFFESTHSREFERHKRQIPYITSMLTKQVLFLTN